MSNGVEITTIAGANVMRFVRPEKKNALTAAMYDAMNLAIAAGDEDHAVAAHVFLGSNGVFTSGNDLGDFMARSKGSAAAVEPVARFVLKLPLVKKPMIAAVDGLAVGIGTTLLFHCDLVYATEAASLRTPFVDLGLVPEAGSSLLAPIRLGYARAFELLVLGEPMTARAALAAGLVNQIVPAEDLEAAALSSALKLAAKPPEAVALSRRLLRGDPAEVSTRIRQELTLFDERLTSPEAREAFTAFAEKRQPDFTRASGRS